jgi:hypothetical protein
LHISNNNVACDLFADDNSLHTCGVDLDSVQNNLQDGLNDVFEWCRQNRMAIHPQKTKCMVLTSRQKHQRKPLTLSLILGENRVEQVSEHRVLGVIIDNEFKWQSHIEKLCKRLAKNLFLLGQLRHYVDSASLKIFFQAHLLSHVNYVSTVWSSASEVHLKKLNSLYRRAAKLILPDQSLSTAEKMKKLEILPLNKQFEFNKCVLMYKVHIGQAPPYLGDLFQQAPARYGSNNYRLPLPRIDLYKTSFAFAGSSVWNCLPAEMKTCPSLHRFKSKLRKTLID